jgi:hypothetical protein
VRSHALAGRFVFRGRFCADDNEPIASVGLEHVRWTFLCLLSSRLEVFLFLFSRFFPVFSRFFFFFQLSHRVVQESVLHLIQRGRALSNSVSDPNVSPRPGRLSRTNSEATDAPHHTAAHAHHQHQHQHHQHHLHQQLQQHQQQNMTLSVNGMQFTVPVNAAGGLPTTVQVHVPVHLQRATQLRQTDSSSSTSSTSSVGAQGEPQQQQHAVTSPGHSRSSSLSSASPSTLSPSSSRDAISPNPAVAASSLLLHAVRSGDLAEARELLANGANASLLHGTVTPFHAVALQSDPAMVELLLAQPGVNTELKNRNGETALHYATYHRNARVQKALVAARANLHARTHSGDTPLHLAVSVGATGEVLDQLIAPMSASPFNPRQTCVLRTAMTIALDDSLGRSVLARAVVKGNVQTVGELLALMPKSDGAPPPATPSSGVGGVDDVASALLVWQQILLACDAFGRVCDANLLLAAARHGDATDGVFALVLRAWWRSVSPRLTRDAARSLLARYLTMMSRDQSVCSLLKMDTDTIFDRYGLADDV